MFVRVLLFSFWRNLGPFVKQDMTSENSGMLRLHLITRLLGVDDGLLFRHRDRLASSYASLLRFSRQLKERGSFSVVLTTKVKY